ncbi:hypothetical protein ACS0TY_033424 [Phlomoides rotata]
MCLYLGAAKQQLLEYVRVLIGNQNLPSSRTICEPTSSTRRRKRLARGLLPRATQPSVADQAANQGRYMLVRSSTRRPSDQIKLIGDHEAIKIEDNCNPHRSDNMVGQRIKEDQPTDENKAR